MLKKEKYRTGNFVLNGKVMGEHRGIPFYTIGQKKGLGLKHHKALYVAHIDVQNNNIILKEDEPSICRALVYMIVIFFMKAQRLKMSRLC